MNDLREKQRGNFPANREFLKQSGVLDKQQKILELGCGRGAVLEHLRGQNLEVIGIDRNFDYLEEVREVAPCARMDVRTLGFPAGTFDVVLSFDVFEHIPDTEQHLSEVKRILRPGGNYLFSTPNKWTNIP